MVKVIEQKKFKIGDTFSIVDIFTGANHLYKVISTETKNRNTVTFEITKYEVDGVYKETRELETLYDVNNGIQYVVLWEYCGHYGYLYAATPEDADVWED